jgi:hypothetical protein
LTPGPAAAIHWPKNGMAFAGHPQHSYLPHATRVNRLMPDPLTMVLGITAGGSRR